MTDQIARVIIRMNNGNSYFQEFATNEQAHGCMVAVMETLQAGHFIDLKPFRNPNFRGEHVALPAGISEILFDPC